MTKKPKEDAVAVLAALRARTRDRVRACRERQRIREERKTAKVERAVALHEKKARLLSERRKKALRAKKREEATTLRIQEKAERKARLDAYISKHYPQNEIV